MMNCIEYKGKGVFISTYNSVSLSFSLMTALAKPVFSVFRHRIYRNDALDFFVRLEDMLIGMSADVSKCRLTQSSRSRCL
jgi:hypothetical protein